jgi:hypothetical protein
MSGKASIDRSFDWAVAAKQKIWRELIRLRQFVLRAYGDKLPASFHSRLLKAQRAYAAAEILQRNKRVFKAVADPEKIMWVRPADVKFKLANRQIHKLSRNEILGGDWDLDRTKIEDTSKYRSMVQHFNHGVAWENTDLFRRYAERLNDGAKLRGTKSIVELKEIYDETVDKLYLSIRRDGFVLPRRGRRTKNLPQLYIGRDGELLYGRQGNHRYAIARLLNLEFIPCVVHVRHIEWQEVREKAFDLGPDAAREFLSTKLVAHPDLADLLAPLWRNRKSAATRMLQE